MKVMSLVNTMIIQTLSEAETKRVPVWEDDAVESLDLKVGCSVCLTRNVDLDKDDCNGAVVQFLSLTPSGLRLLSHFTKSDLCEAQQGLLSPLLIPSPFPWLWFR